MEKSGLYICSTCYHLYVTLLKQIKDYKNNIDLVICNNINDGKQFVERLKASNLFRNVWFVDQCLFPKCKVNYNRFERVFFQHRRQYRLLTPFIPFNVHDYADIYIYHDAIALGRYLADAHKSYHLIEDSFNFFQRLDKTPQFACLRAKSPNYNIARLLNVGYFPLGFSLLLKDVEVNENKSLQISCKKIKEVPRKKLREKLSDNDLSLLAYIFDCHSVPSFGNNSALVLTEPLYIDKRCSDLDKQVAIYDEIVAFLKNKGYNVTIKPHPRDLCDYTKLGVVLLNGNVPIELMVDLGLNEPDCLVALSSSALFSMKAKKKYRWTDDGDMEEIK